MAVTKLLTVAVDPTVSVDMMVGMAEIDWFAETGMTGPICVALLVALTSIVEAGRLVATGEATELGEDGTPPLIGETDAEDVPIVVTIEPVVGALSVLEMVDGAETIEVERPGGKVHGGGLHPGPVGW